MTSFLEMRERGDPSVGEQTLHLWKAGIELQTLGSWTTAARKVERGIGPDECRVFGTESSAHPGV